MAGAGYKLFNTGDVLTAAQVNTYLMEQTIMVFASATARNTALSGVVAQGMQCFLKDTNTMQYYDGAAWQTLSTGGDITGVTAGTGISGGGTSGTVTVSIDTATTVDKTTVQTLTNKTLTAPIISTISNTGTLTLPTSTDTLVGRATTDTLTNKTISASSNTISGVINNTLTTTTGDIIYASSANTPARLGIGTTGQILTVAGGIPSWAAAPSSSATAVGCSIGSDSVSISNATYTAITFANERFDTDAFHSQSSNTSRITIPTGKGGKYLFIGSTRWSSGSGDRYMKFYKNGVAQDGTTRATSSTFMFNTTFYADSLAAGDYIEMYVYQSSGGSITAEECVVLCTFLGA